MNTSEALDLSKENIQPLKQGRNAVKLGTALQAQTNAELHQQLLAEREQFELLIRMYEGDDPLKPHYDYVNWIEQSFPKHGPESNLIQILENTLSTFKDDERYKQDLRYSELFIKYIDMQPHPLEIYQIVYDQGLCTMCAPFYIAWAEELDKNNDMKKADQVFELGIRVKAEPLEMLQEAHLRFQLCVGRRLLGRQDDVPEMDPENNRQALHKLQKRNIHSARNPVGAPGRIKQKPLGSQRNDNSAPFQVFQGDDEDCSSYSDSNGKSFPKQSLLNKENSLKPGQWSQSGGKHHSKKHVISTHPSFQVHEDEEANIRSNQCRTPSVPGALKTRKKDNFTCPLAVFEPPDPTKKPMYCKSKVYAGGSEFQFEELRAALYNRRYEQLSALKRQEAENHIQNEMKAAKDVLPLTAHLDLSYNSDKEQVEKSTELPKQVPTRSPVEEPEPCELHLESRRTSSEGKIMCNNKPQVDTEKSYESSSQEQCVKPVPVFENKVLHLDANTSLFHCQSFTVNTKEAMNVVQEMWNSPSPAPGFGRNARLSRAYPVSPGLDESGMFKVPPVPPPPSKAESKSISSFPIYSDSEPEVPSSNIQIYSDNNPEPVETKHFPIYSDEAPTPSPKQNFQIYSDHEEENPLSKNCDTVPFNPLIQPLASAEYKTCPEQDPATLKMLAFESDSDGSADESVLLSKKSVKHSLMTNRLPTADIPQIRTIAPTPVKDTDCNAVGTGHLSHPAFQEEDQFEDMTCNTKAFNFVLPSSTPLNGHFKNKTTNGHLEKNGINGSYISEDVVKKCGPKQELSMIFEASKERSSSFSGSSGSKTQGSVCTAPNTSIQPVPEVVEKLAQISGTESPTKLEKSLCLLKLTGSIDPFSTEMITKLLTHIGYPKKHHLIGLHILDLDSPTLHVNSTAKLGGCKYSIVGELGKGSYARVLKAMSSDDQCVALKQQRPAWQWEWYIVQELQSRLSPNMMRGFLHISNAYIYKNASILESEWAQYGSLLSIVNKLKISGKSHDLQIAMLFSIQLISIVEHLHKCKIIHGDVKPDNFVLFSLPTSDCRELCLKLIDFGRSIDMTLFPENTTFTTVVTTDGFQCNEMKEGRPWTYQADLYGLAGSIYCVLFYDYMKVTKKDQKWQLSQKIPRYLAPDLWQEIFYELLNVESCEKLSDLSLLRDKLEKRYSVIHPTTVNQSLIKLNNVLSNK